MFRGLPRRSKTEPPSNNFRDFIDFGFIQANTDLYAFSLQK
jgi:hypothetical protein